MRFGEAEARLKVSGFPGAKTKRNWLASCDLLKRPAINRNTSGEIKLDKSPGARRGTALESGREMHI